MPLNQPTTTLRRRARLRYPWDIHIAFQSVANFFDIRFSFAIQSSSDVNALLPTGSCPPNRLCGDVQEMHTQHSSRGSRVSTRQSGGPMHTVWRATPVQTLRGVSGLPRQSPRTAASVHHPQTQRRVTHGMRREMVGNCGRMPRGGCKIKET